MKDLKRITGRSILAGAILLFAVTLSTQAQDSRMGIKGGLNLSMLTVEDIDDQDNIDREEFHILDTGVSGGVGVTLRPFTFGINYSLGLRPVAKAEEPMEALLGNAANRTVMVYVGLVF